ncbi:MAG TPA: tetratricopeptide repeat protein [Candidatus Methylomirabilis sp.]|nr:tetratricopeptide repeat protein [Candidatus Methylomirabilis sp.]
MDEELQLDLFTWDRVKTGEGFDALARLDFERALAIFESVLSQWPGHPDASAGLQMAAAWDASLKEAESLPGKDAAAFLWERLKSYQFGQCGKALRRGLLQRTVALMEGDCQVFIPPDLCLGRLLFELEEYSKAEAALSLLLENHGPNGRILIWLGNCLFRQGKEDEARFVYAKAFLGAPWEVELDELDDKELLEAIADEDIYSAAVCGWLRRLLPFVDVEVACPHDRKHEESLLVYHAVGGAEQARARGAHEEMVEQRRLLRQLARLYSWYTWVGCRSAQGLGTPRLRIRSRKCPRGRRLPVEAANGIVCRVGAAPREHPKGAVRPVELDEPYIRDAD